MSQEAKPDGGEGSGDLRVEHILAALEHIGTLVAQLQTAVGALDPKTVVGRAIRYPEPIPGSELLGHCMPAGPEVAEKS
jgi:hypothetical protein